MAGQTLHGIAKSFEKTPLVSRADTDLETLQAELLDTLGTAEELGIRRQIEAAKPLLRHVSLERATRSGDTESVPREVSMLVRRQLAFEALSKSHLDSYGIGQGHEDWDARVQALSKAMAVVVTSEIIE